jgi:hypothetical protein
MCLISQETPRADERESWVEHYGQEIRESAEQKAVRLLELELKRLGWEEADLAGSEKSRRKKSRSQCSAGRRFTKQLTNFLSGIENIRGFLETRFMEFHRVGCCQLLGRTIVLRRLHGCGQLVKKTTRQFSSGNDD